MKTIPEALTELARQPNIADFLEAGGYKMPVFSLEGNTDMGPSAPCYSCPVALYLTDVCGRPTDVAMHKAAFVGEEAITHRLPLVVQQFISQFDRGLHRNLKTLVPLNA